MDNNSIFNASESVADQRMNDEPHLNIDIEIGAKKHRITLFNDSNCTKLAADFARAHNLSKDMQNTLESQLKENMSFFA
jgi:hypothetical protein